MLVDYATSQPGTVCEMIEPAHVTTTRTVYDASAHQYAEAIGTEISAATEGPIDRAVLTAFAELVSTSPAGLVADIGCGPGRVAAYLADRDIEVVGVDASAAMVEIARVAHPSIRFDVGLQTALPFEDGTLRGCVCWYSIIHTPPNELAPVFAELNRVLRPDGDVLIAFQAGDGQAIVKPNAYGTNAVLTNYRHSVADVAAQLASLGFLLKTTLVREPELSHESAPQAFLLARSAGE